MHLKKRKEYSKESYIPNVIGIWGQTKGCGVTHTAIAAATFAYQQRGYKTALIELNTSHELRSLCGDYEGTEFFLYRGIHCYPDLSKEGLIRVLSMNYQMIIVDFGHQGDRLVKEFRLCHTRLVILDLAVWKQKKAAAWLEEQKEEDRETVSYLFLHGDDKLRKQYHKEYGISCYNIPYQPDAFCLMPYMIQLLEQFL